MSVVLKKEATARDRADLRTEHLKELTQPPSVETVFRFFQVFNESLILHLIGLLRWFILASLEGGNIFCNSINFAVVSMTALNFARDFAEIRRSLAKTMAIFVRI